MAARQSHDAASPFTPDAWTRQDGVIVTEPSADRRSHIGHRWDERCRPGWEGYNIRQAWREGETVSYGDDEVVARLHTGAAVVLVVELGFVQTVITAADAGYADVVAAAEAEAEIETAATTGPAADAQPDEEIPSSEMRFTEGSR
ncbi:hypothetical protein [Halobellus rubicundus]|uniref:RelE toxin-related domain-containing protein n=1 Tax=Halobellus rubicundus TaxID=2996466 RepID=A0ABD5MLA9_9EURY